MSITDFVTKMQADHLDPAAIAAFRDAYAQLASGATGMMPEATIAPVSDLPQLADLDHYLPAGQQALARTVVLRLNGGLGTGMGLEQAKSLLLVRDGDTFLDIVAKQHRHLMSQTGIPLPLLFMNSFATDADTQALLANYPDIAGHYLLQGRVPKVRADNLQPVAWPDHPALEWCPPGHGELYRVLWSSGALDQLIADGYEYLFSANIDNLGATPDLRILGYIASHQIPFLMEVTARTDADRKGGHLAQASDGRLVLRESAQCPSADMDAFQDISRHRYFNTNNVWLALRPLRDLLAHYGGFLPLPIIVNRKTVDVRDATSPAVIQLESAMGAAIGLIAGAQAVAVPRQRFMPVKNCQDLLLLRSDRFMVNAQYHVVAVDERPLPTIHLDQRFYRVIADFEARFAPGIPRLHDCSALHVEGNITFAADVTISGDVILRAGDLAVHVAPHAFFTSGVHEIQ
jgi:UTP--glucose-1-phosphate uridylyltransferase